MSDIMRPIPFAQLMDWALNEYQARGAVFGAQALYRHRGGKALSLFGEKIETPFGPAAGPHTQLAQNIVCAYACGARFFELKTVQVIDGEELPVSKPCILAAGEGYNVEWSTELRVEAAYDEYVKAWYAVKLLARALDLGAADGFIFNMSVGYDLQGIKSAKIDRFIEGMKAAGDAPIWKECEAWARQNVGRLPGVTEEYIQAIDSRVCQSITLSTLHGCPPEEIERIAAYLIEEKGLHTFVKCNPTLLGYEFARQTLDEMGYDYVSFDDAHFKGDLQYEDAVPMFRRLLARAEARGLQFGVKLTNTFPVQIRRGELPGEEMYMSGKSLYPLAIALAAKLEESFGGGLRVSYSGGADYFNIAKIYQTGVWPITLATTLLKPGGYNRLRQMAELLAAQAYAPFAGVDVPALRRLADEATRDARHLSPVKPEPTRKLAGKVPLADCFLAPCQEGCPIRQDAPAYLRLAAEGRYDEALKVILEKNALPFITGAICNHRCQAKCTRGFYEEPLAIRAVKLLCAERAMDGYLAALAPAPRRPERVAVVGGGPAGMAAAYFLARAGARVTIYEKREALGGVVRHAIPAFRIADAAIERDAALLAKLGVEIHLNAEARSAQALFDAGHTHVIAAIGAWAPGGLRLEKGQALDALEFLEAAKKHPAALRLGRAVAVVGGGNTAMDAARAAKRLPGVERVALIYRRTRKEMPADCEELSLALQDGVEFCELRSPLAHEGGVLRCEVMRLGEADASGRFRPQSTGEYVDVPADAVISAVGERVDQKCLADLGVARDERGRAAALRLSDRLYAAGDARRGPATVVEAIADAQAIAGDILGVEPLDSPLRADPAALQARRGVLRPRQAGEAEGERCLGCPAVCENCVDVCPNRANAALRVPGMEKEQILHIDRLCNECGNCQAFCPYDSAPYREKFTLFSTPEDFESSQNEGFLPLGAGAVRVRFAGRAFETNPWTGEEAPPQLRKIMQTVLRDCDSLL